MQFQMIRIIDTRLNQKLTHRTVAILHNKRSY